MPKLLCGKASSAIPGNAESQAVPKSSKRSGIRLSRKKNFPSAIPASGRQAIKSAKAPVHAASETAGIKITFAAREMKEHTPNSAMTIGVPARNAAPEIQNPETAACCILNNIF